jgi:hypothetical protein
VVLEPMMDDPSHDVRARVLSGLAYALAQIHPPDELRDRLEHSERHATRRLVAVGALILRARAEAEGPSVAALREVADSGPPMAQQAARLGLGLFSSSADGLEFLASLVP